MRHHPWSDIIMQDEFWVPLAGFDIFTEGAELADLDEAAGQRVAVADMGAPWQRRAFEFLWARRQMLKPSAHREHVAAAGPAMRDLNAYDPYAASLVTSPMAVRLHELTGDADRVSCQQVLAELRPHGLVGPLSESLAALGWHSFAALQAMQYVRRVRTDAATSETAAGAVSPTSAISMVLQSSPLLLLSFDGMDFDDAFEVAQRI